MAENDESKNKKGRGPDRQPRKKADPDARKRRLKNLKSLQGKSEEELDAILARAEAEAPDVARQVTENILNDQREEFETLWRGIAESYRRVGSEKATVERYCQDLALALMVRRILLLRTVDDRISAAAANYSSLIVQRAQEDLDKYRKRSDDAELAWAFAGPLRRQADGTVTGGSIHFGLWEVAVGPLKDAVGQRLLSVATSDEGRIWREVWDLIDSPPESWNALPGVTPEEVLAEFREQASEMKRQHHGSRSSHDDSGDDDHRE